MGVEGSADGGGSGSGVVDFRTASAEDVAAELGKLGVGSDPRGSYNSHGGTNTDIGSAIGANTGEVPDVVHERFNPPDTSSVEDWAKASDDDFSAHMRQMFGINTRTPHNEHRREKS